MEDFADIAGIELLVIDDCSTDKTLNILKSFVDNRIIIVEKNENNTLHQLKGEQTEVVKELSKEKEIQEDLEDKKRSVRKLDNLIADMVRREIEKSRKAANNNNTTSSTNKITLTPEAAALSANFAENKSLVKSCDSISLSEFSITPL